MVRYELAHDITERLSNIIEKLEMAHVDEARLTCVRSRGSRSRFIIARCHGLPKVMQLAIRHGPHYVIELISERFDKLSREEQTKVLIHEIMHIPHSFGGGFRHHKPYVTRQKVERTYQKLLETNKI